MYFYQQEGDTGFELTTSWFRNTPKSVALGSREIAYFHDTERGANLMLMIQFPFVLCPAATGPHESFCLTVLFLFLDKQLRLVLLADSIAQIASLSQVSISHWISPFPPQQAFIRIYFILTSILAGNGAMTTWSSVFPHDVYVAVKQTYG